MGRDGVCVISALNLKGFDPRARMGRDLLELLHDGRHAVSIHAPAWGATFWSFCTMGDMRFRSTRPHGARLDKTTFFADTLDVSIHAPAWGATRGFPHVLKSMNVSIHAPAWGATFTDEAFMGLTVVSIHAPAWGATNALRNYQRGWNVSIHAPAWGATRDDANADPSNRVSIHAPAWGATTSPLIMRPRTGGFDPRARMGRDV